MNENKNENENENEKKERKGRMKVGYSMHTINPREGTTCVHIEYLESIAHVHPHLHIFTYYSLSRKVKLSKVGMGRQYPRATSHTWHITRYKVKKKRKRVNRTREWSSDPFCPHNDKRSCWRLHTTTQHHHSHHRLLAIPLCPHSTSPISKRPTDEQCYCLSCSC